MAVEPVWELGEAATSQGKQGGANPCLGGMRMGMAGKGGNVLLSTAGLLRRCHFPFQTLLNLQQNTLKCLHCESHTRDESIHLSPHVTDVT